MRTEAEVESGSTPRSTHRLTTTGGSRLHTAYMSTTDYLLNGVLIALVVLQLRGRRLTAQTLLLPVAIVVGVAIEYLHGIPTADNDLVLAVCGGVAGVLLGVGCGIATAVFRRSDGAIVAKAGPVAAVLWVAGIGSRVAFSLYATHGGGGAIERFSTAHGNYQLRGLGHVLDPDGAL